MDDLRRFVDLDVGHPGVHSYISSKDRSVPGILHTTRLTSQGPNFKLAGTTEEWYSPSRLNSVEGPVSWQARQVQERWLANSHPAAFIGAADTFSEILKDDSNQGDNTQDLSSDGSLLAIGEMSDLRRPSHVIGIPLLAAATGESGENLRLTRLHDSMWHWGDHQDVVLRQSLVDTAYQGDETIWVGDGLPILNIKFASAAWPSGNLRWLIVQTGASITILQPEYHRFPTLGAVQLDSSQPLSCVDPNPLTSLHQHETGGNELSDVCFSSPTAASPPRIVVVDQCGFWTIWDAPSPMRVGKKMIRLALYKCGHFSNGILDSLPRLSYPARKYGVLSLERVDDESSGRKTSVDQGSATPSQRMLLWNAEEIALLDLDADSLITPKTGILAHSRGNEDRILDIHRSQVHGSHVFVLTTRQIIWYDLLPGSSDLNTSWEPRLILACSLVGILNDNCRMSLCAPSLDNLEESMVFVHNQDGDQLTVYWFYVVHETQLPQWHRCVTALTHADNGPGTRTQLISIQPAELQSSRNLEKTTITSGPGSVYLENEVQFFQAVLLAEDLSVHCGMYTSSRDVTSEVTLPTSRIAHPRTDQDFKQGRKLLLQYLGDSFVVPDTVEDETLESLWKGHRLGPAGAASKEELKAPAAHSITLQFGRIFHLLASSLQAAIDRGPRGLPSDLVAAVQQVIERGISEGSLPLTPWMQLFQDAQQDVSYNKAGEGMETEVDALLDNITEPVVITQLRRRGTDEPPNTFLGYPYLLRKYSELWLDTAADTLPAELQQVREIWVNEVARDVFLSSYGVMLRNVPLHDDGGTSEATDSPANSATQTRGSSRSPHQSPRIASSPPASSVSQNEVPDAAFQRLQLLAPTLEPGALGSLKQANILSYWPAETGVDADNYVSSIALAREEKHSHAKQRLQKMKDKKKAQAERYRLPTRLRQLNATGGGAADELAEPSSRPPPVQTMSSQQGFPGSSQSQGFLGPSLTMSQPVSGAFGDRKKVKKAKRKSGFR